MFFWGCKWTEALVTAILLASLELFPRQALCDARAKIFRVAVKGVKAEGELKRGRIRVQIRKKLEAT